MTELIENAYRRWREKPPEGYSEFQIFSAGYLAALRAPDSNLLSQTIYLLEQIDQQGAVQLVERIRASLARPRSRR